ncbi:MAG: SapC family protein [Burkholderiales bacterium]
MSNYQAVSVERHAGRCWQRHPNYLFAAADAVAPLTAAELPKAMMCFPIAFIEQAGNLIPVAVLGLLQGKNFFVAQDGTWLGKCIPAMFRFHPFRLMQTGNRQHVLCIDEDNGLVADGAGGERFFAENGQPTQAVLDILDGLKQIEQGRLATAAASAALQKFNLIRSWPVTLKTAQGEQQVAGLLQVDEAALNNLSGEDLLEVSRAGALPLAYCQLLSMQNLSLLGELAARQMPGASPARPIVPATPAPKVLLVSHNWSTLTEMPYLVKQAGFQVDVLCTVDNPAVRNGFYDCWIDSGATLNSLLGVLLKLLNDNAYAHIMIGDDPILWKIYREKIVSLWHLLPILNQSALPILNKIGLAEHCREHGIPSPEFRRVDSREMAHSALQSLGLPIVVKENYSSGGNSVRIFKDEQSYYGYMDAFEYHEPLLAQQFIVGDNISVEALFKNGTLLDYVCSVDVDGTTGPSTKRRYFPNEEEIENTVRMIGRSALLHGFVSIGILKSVQSATSWNYYLYEADPRPNKWVPYARWFGCDFSAAFKAFLAAEDNAVGMVADAARYDDVDGWEIEFFPNHAAKLLNSGRTAEAICHLLDFNKTYKYAIYDHVLLKDKMEAIRRNLKIDSSPVSR